jgi:hypothetical protein
MKGRNMRTLLLIAAVGLAAPAWADEVRLQENAPDRHVVVKGDTLWGISEKFLKDPWLWPEVWQLNKEQIRNPHLIYPGDVVVLTMEGGKPRLSLENGGKDVVKLSPQIRSEPILVKEKGIPAIEPKHIAPFLSLARVVDPDVLDAAPKLLGAADERVLIMKGDSVYASAGNRDTANWQVIRPGKQLLDPDTGEVLGLEAENVGRMRTTIPGNPQTLQVEQAGMEIMIGDKLLPYAPIQLDTLTPHAPAKNIEGKIIQAYGGFSATAQYATVVINRGSRDGVEAGHVLAIQRQGRVLPGTGVEGWRYGGLKCVKAGKTRTNDFYDPKEMLQECSELPPGAKQVPVRYSDIGCLKPGAKISAFEFFNPKEVYQLHCRPGEEIQNQVQLPGHSVGLLFVYRVHDKVAYGLIMRADGPVYLLDAVKNP